MTNLASIRNLRADAISLASALVVLYNKECWSLDAMMRKVADTPGPFAMGVREISAE
ncbi:hypothetical protein GCM10011571_23760 [Marinithermofilum abyssi]|uniref:Uncharacterized protein n=1 Tax=Marinithermofilum abyssi TaxID=1571185 RepID=A0A8J2Y9E7_9BACL|nr:hypothetical protein GCM10011571_23760 [Marinithermofilum abyssi]